MSLGDPYATLAQLRARVNIPAGDTTQDAYLTNALAAASQDLEGALGRQFNDAATESARIYYTDDLVTIEVHDFQSSAGFALALDFSNSGTYSSVVAAANYQLEPLNGIYDGSIGWPFWRIHLIQTWGPVIYTSIGFPRANVQVTARWGWAAVPAAVVEATLMLAEETYKMRDAPFGVVGSTITGGALRVRENPKIMSLVGRYDKMPIKVA